MAAAVELACTMFVARGYEEPLTVGIGSDLADFGLLTAVDVPIVVRSQSDNQTELIRQLPGVYVTSVAGMAGWSEAVLGRTH
jgi:predicted mannosyl-3-phosphoglycerate phosphatase (HAD superfamily)